MQKTSANFLDKLLGRFDLPMLTLITVMILAVVAGAAFDQSAMAHGLTLAKAWLLARMSWFYVLASCLFLGVIVFLAFSKYGSLVLGEPGDKPEFSSFAWISMLISCGVGVGYAYWPVGESMWHYFNTPYLAASESIEARPVAIAISMLHWGFHTWSIYALAGLAIAVPAFRLGKPMNISISLFGLLKEKSERGPICRLVEFLSAFSIIAGVSTGLGLGLIVLKGGLGYIFKIELAPLQMSLVLLALVLCYMLAAMTGIGKGIRWLAEANSYVALVWIIFIVLAGPTVYMLNGMLEAFGTYLQNIVYMSFWTDAAGQKAGWLGDWTVFYWLWWISWAPFCGGFFARISRGRTIREFIAGVVLVPTIISCVWFGLLGSGSQYVEFNQLAPLWDVVQSDAGKGIYVVADAFGGGLIINLIILASMFIFLATTADAASFFVAMQFSKGSLHPKPAMILVCGALMGALTVALLLTGGLGALQVGAVIAGGVFVLVMVGMVVSLFITLANL